MATAPRNALGTYAAIRFATGKKAPGVITPLGKALGLLTVATALLPVAIVEATIKKARTAQAQQQAQARAAHRAAQSTAGGYPRNFQDHINQLTEDMQ